MRAIVYKQSLPIEHPESLRPHPDALDPAKCEALVAALEAL